MFPLSDDNPRILTPYVAGSLGGASAAFTRTAEGGVAFWAHVGGFIAGLVLVSLFKKRDVGLWQPRRSRALEMRRRRGPWG
jgi:rhomboid family protein